jgi:hypothetical protein
VEESGDLRIERDSSVVLATVRVVRETELKDLEYVADTKEA